MNPKDQEALLRNLKQLEGIIFGCGHSILRPIVNILRSKGSPFQI